jgi:hypothetical protein
MASVDKDEKRRRSKTACEPCRERKRKCDGHKPCRTCSRFEYDCYYPSRRNAAIPSSPPPRTKPAGQADATSGSSNHFSRALEANSGAAFMRRLALAIDSANAPKLHLFAWNVGRQLPSVPASARLHIVDIVSEAEMQYLASVYFERIDPCYGIIHKDSFIQHMGARWHSQLPTGTYDSVLCGVAALGSFFSRGPEATEERLVALSRNILETYCLTETPSVDHITGWVCRVIYMRLAANPLDAWVTSCTAMHLIEAAGLHTDDLSGTVLATAFDCDVHTRRRITGVAQHLNTWISFDLGLSRVSIRGAVSVLPSARAGDYSDKLLSLLPISAKLDPLEPQDDTDLKSTLVRLVNSEDTQSPLILAQCNLLLCILRRMHSYGSLSTYSPDLPTEAILAFMAKALRAVRDMVSTQSPWHHMANVPFQIVCILLVIDSRASIRMLKDAMQTLLHAASFYETTNLREAHSTAGLLIWLYQRRRAEDVETISDVFSSYPPRLDANGVSQSPSVPVLDNELFPFQMDDVAASIPSLREADLDQLLSNYIFG